MANNNRYNRFVKNLESAVYIDEEIAAPVDYRAQASNTPFGEGELITPVYPKSAPKAKSERAYQEQAREEVRERRDNGALIASKAIAGSAFNIFSGLAGALFTAPKARPYGDATRAPGITRLVVGVGSLAFAALSAYMTQQIIKFPVKGNEWLNYALPLSITFVELILWHFIRTGPAFIKLLLIGIEIFDIWFNYSGFRIAQGVAPKLEFGDMLTIFFLLVSTLIAIVPELGFRFAWYGRLDNE